MIDQWKASGRDNFLSDEIIQNATLYRLETLADAAGKLSVDLKASYSQVSWRDIVNFRNRVSHGYLELDLDLV